MTWDLAQDILFLAICYSPVYVLVRYCIVPWVLADEEAQSR